MNKLGGGVTKDTILFFCDVEDTFPGCKPYPLMGPGATIDIVRGVVHPSGLEEFIDRGRDGFTFINNFFNIDRLVPELPEMMFGVVLVAVCKKLELTHQPFLPGLIGVFGDGAKQLFCRDAFEVSKYFR